jgi:hypothetical protein
MGSSCMVMHWHESWLGTAQYQRNTQH